MRLSSGYTEVEETKSTRLTGEVSYRRNQLEGDRDERFIGNAVDSLCAIRQLCFVDKTCTAGSTCQPKPRPKKPVALETCSADRIFVTDREYCRNID